MPATLKDIAEKVGKSVTTVSRALHDYDDVSLDTKERVRLVADDLGYSPHTYAQRLQKQRSDTIGFVIPTFEPRLSDPFFSEFLAGVGNNAAQLGYDLLVSTQPAGEKEQEVYRKMLEGGRVDGFIIVRTRCEDSRIQYLINKEAPFIAFGSVEGENTFPFVDEDGAHGMRLVADHLVTLGHTHIACIAPTPELTFSNLRLGGLRMGLNNHGITLDEALIRFGDLTQQSGFEHAQDLLRMTNPPTAIVACNDLMALGAMSATRELDLVVGRDIAITGFDDIPMATYCNPPLTTVHQPVYKIGGMVCEMLVDLIEGNPREQQQIVLKPNLMVRQSCGEDPITTSQT